MFFLSYPYFCTVCKYCVYNKKEHQQHLDCVLTFIECHIFEANQEGSKNKNCAICDRTLEKQKRIYFECCRKYIHFKHVEDLENQQKIKDNKCLICDKIPVRYGDEVKQLDNQDKNNKEEPHHKTIHITPTPKSKITRTLNLKELSLANEREDFIGKNSENLNDDMNKKYINTEHIDHLFCQDEKESEEDEKKTQKSSKDTLGKQLSNNKREGKLKNKNIKKKRNKHNNRVKKNNTKTLGKKRKKEDE